MVGGFRGEGTVRVKRSGFAWLDASPKQLPTPSPTPPPHHCHPHPPPQLPTASQLPHLCPRSPWHARLLNTHDLLFPLMPLLWGRGGGEGWGRRFKEETLEEEEDEEGEGEKKIPRKHHLFIARLELSGTVAYNFDIMRVEDE